MSGQGCKNNLACIERFLLYPQSLLVYTHKKFGYNNIPDEKTAEFTKSLHTEAPDIGIIYLKEFIKNWNIAPKYCCPKDLPNVGRCVGHPSSCRLTGKQNTLRKRDVTLGELLNIKKNAGVIPQYSECLGDSDCKKTGWREPNKNVCRDYRCTLIPKDNWKPPKSRK